MKDIREVLTQDKAPLSPTYGTRWINVSDGVEKIYLPPGEWRPVRGIPVGSWTINPLIADANVVSTLNDLKDLLLLAGIIQ